MATGRDVSDSVATNAQVEDWFRFLREREDRFLPRFNAMVGYAYGFAAAARECGREDLAAKKVEWLRSAARKHGALVEDEPSTTKGSAG
jgi:hypothetical protein